VATVGSGDQETIVGLGGYVRSGAAAEIAFAVEEDFQGRGIASRLLQQLAGIARASGIVRFEADVLAENCVNPLARAMAASCRRSRLAIPRPWKSSSTAKAMSAAAPLRT